VPDDIPAGRYRRLLGAEARRVLAGEPNTVVQKLLRLARHGVEIFYIPGNHDEALKNYFDSSFGNVKLKKDYVHVAATASATRCCTGISTTRSPPARAGCRSWATPRTTCS